MSCLMFVSFIVSCYLQAVLPLPILLTKLQTTSIHTTLLQPTTTLQTTLLPTTPSPNTFEEKQVKATENMGIEKRFDIFGKWNKHQLTYRINSYPSTTINLPTRSNVDDQIATALQDWSNVADVKFTRTNSPNADVVIDFMKRNHAGSCSFDGPGGAYAHAFGPGDGRVHLDDDEKWSSDSYSGVNLRQVMTHEVGHVLGLTHSQLESSVMFATHRYQFDFKLHQSEVRNIVFLYGKKTETKSTTTSRQFDAQVDIFNLPNTPSFTPFSVNLPQTPSSFSTIPSINDDSWLNWFYRNIG